MNILATQRQRFNSNGGAYYHAILLVDGKEHRLTFDGTSAFVTAHEAQRQADKAKARIISLIRAWLRRNASSDGIAAAKPLTSKRLNSRSAKRPSITELL